MSLKRKPRLSQLPSLAETNDTHEAQPSNYNPNLPTIAEEPCEPAASGLVRQEISPIASPVPDDTSPSHEKPQSHFWLQLRHLLSLLFSFLWLAPITTLLVLNFKNHVIGASVWCPFGHCFSNAFNSDAIATALRLNKRDRDVLAGLQFVAQAFEVWFLVIATALLYDVGMIFARSPGGLPIGYLMTHLQFSDVNYLFHSNLWTSAFPSTSASRQEQSKQSVVRFFLFALLAAFLTILTNLMGAATAVLLLPSLSWVETPKVPNEHFSTINLAQAPSPPFCNVSCTTAQLLAGNYSCTSDMYGPSLDEWAATAQASVRQYQQPSGIAILGTSQEAAVQFALNASSDLQVIWVANRQVSKGLSKDYLEAIGRSPDYLRAVGETDDGSADPRFNKSLQTILQRSGPSIGVQSNCYAGNLSVTNIADDKEVHCFTNWSLDGVHDYTKCFRIGPAFSSVNNRSRFYLGINSSTIAVDSSFSDLATFYNSTTDFGSGILPCLSNTTAPSCNWDKIFSTPVPNEFRNSSKNVGLISYSIPSPPNPQARIYCDTTTYLSFPTYTLDTTISSNELHLMQLNHLSPLPTNSTPLTTSPDWFLAAWSVDRNGTVPSTRPIARELLNVLEAFWRNQNPEGIPALELFLYHIYALGQAMSLVTYNSTPPPLASSTSQINAEHPILTSNARLHVWAWGLGGRTSRLGVVIAICGCLCVLARVVLGVWQGTRREISPTDVIAAALDREPFSDDRMALTHDGKQKVRLPLVDQLQTQDRRGTDGRPGNDTEGAAIVSIDTNIRRRRRKRSVRFEAPLQSPPEMHQIEGALSDHGKCITQ